jgi:hypothetical protein
LTAQPARAPAGKQAYSRPARASGRTTPSSASRISPHGFAGDCEASLRLAAGDRRQVRADPKLRVTRPEWIFARQVTTARCDRWQHLRLGGTGCPQRRISTPTQSHGTHFFARNQPLFSAGFSNLSLSAGGHGICEHGKATGCRSDCRASRRLCLIDSAPEPRLLQLMGSCFGGDLATESAAKDAGDARMTVMAEVMLARH